MTDDAQTTLLAAMLESLTLVQAQIAQADQRAATMEQQLSDLHVRLDHIDAAQAGTTDLLPLLEMVLARMTEDRQFATASFAAMAELGAFTHAAAMGNRAPLPVEVADDPILERFALTQPADFVSQDRALVEWQKAVGSASSAELAELLARQYQPSPTDTPETRVLRYKLAAITRFQLSGRGAALPPSPLSTVAQDRSAHARTARSEDLAHLWRAGASTALYAEAELAGAVDLFVYAERRAGTISEEQLGAELAVLHRQLGNRIEAGERPSLSSDRRSYSADRAADFGTGERPVPASDRRSYSADRAADTEDDKER